MRARGASVPRTGIRQVERRRGPSWRTPTPALGTTPTSKPPMGQRGSVDTPLCGPFVLLNPTFEPAHQTWMPWRHGHGDCQALPRRMVVEQAWPLSQTRQEGESSAVHPILDLVHTEFEPGHAGVLGTVCPGDRRLTRLYCSSGAAARRATVHLPSIGGPASDGCMRRTPLVRTSTCHHSPPKPRNAPKPLARCTHAAKGRLPDCDLSPQPPHQR